MERYFRKLILLGLTIAAYLGVCFWIPYSKKWLMDDIIHIQARLYFATQTKMALQDKIIAKAEALDIPLEPEQVSVQNINGEIIYIELDLNIPYDILTYNSSLHFEPKIFGLIRGFASAGGTLDENATIDQTLAALSDSTKLYLRNKTLKNYWNDFFAN